MANIKRIGVLSFAKFQAAILSIVGLGAGMLYAIGGLVVDVLVSAGWVSREAAATPGLSFGTVLAFGALVGMPAMAVVFGAVLGVVEALIFNWFVAALGGIELDIEHDEM